MGTVESGRRFPPVTAELLPRAGTTGAGTASRTTVETLLCDVNRANRTMLPLTTAVVVAHLVAPHEPFGVGEPQRVLPGNGLHLLAVLLHPEVRRS